MRRCVIEQFTLFRRLHIGSDMWMKDQIESEFVGDFFRIGHDSSDVFPLLCAGRRTTFVIDSSGIRVSLRRLIVGDHQKGSFESRKQTAHPANALHHGLARIRIGHLYWNERREKLQFTLFESWLKDCCIGWKEAVGAKPRTGEAGFTP